MQSFPLKEFAVLQNICSVSILVGPGLYIVMLCYTYIKIKSFIKKYFDYLIILLTSSSHRTKTAGGN